MVLDTHQTVKRLQQAGFGEEQAEALVTTVSDALNESVATKADLLSLEASLRSEVQEVQSEVQEVRSEVQEVRSELRALELRMTIKLGGILVVGLGLITVLDKLLSMP